MKKKVLSVLLTVVLATGVLAGCGSSAATTATQSESSQAAESGSTAGETGDDTIVIRSCFATGMTGAVNRFAIEKGLYKELGIEFENVEASADTNSTVMSLITRGEIDVADGDPSSYIPGIYNGVPAKLVGNMWRYSGCYWLVANNDIKDFSDLEGKLSGKKVALFGSYDWGDGEWMRTWCGRAKDAGAELVEDEGLIVNNTPDDEGLAACRELGGKLA